MIKEIDDAMCRKTSMTPYEYACQRDERYLQSLQETPVKGLHRPVTLCPKPISPSEAERRYTAYRLSQDLSDTRFLLEQRESEIRTLKQRLSQAKQETQNCIEGGRKFGEQAAIQTAIERQELKTDIEDLRRALGSERLQNQKHQLRISRCKYCAGGFNA